MIFAFFPLDFDLSSGVFHLIRIIATIGAAIVGWFVADPLTRAVYWLALRASTPGLLLFASKSASAFVLALVVFIVMQFVSFGTGGGFGFGPGQGGLPGKGPGQGGDKTADSKNSKSTKDSAQKGPKALEPIEIEIINRKLYKDDERYFLVKRAEPALSRAELEDYLKKNKDKIEVIPILTRYSIGRGGGDSPLDQLLSLTDRYNVRTTQPKRV